MQHRSCVLYTRQKGMQDQLPPSHRSLARCWCTAPQHHHGPAPTCHLPCTLPCTAACTFPAQVLIDRSTARITTGQRVSLNSVEEASKQERDGTPYFVFEHVSQVRV